MSGTTYMTCQTLQQPKYYGAAFEAVFDGRVDNLCVEAYTKGDCRGSADYTICATSTMTIDGLMQAPTSSTKCFSQIGKGGIPTVVGAFQVVKTTPNVVEVIDRPDLGGYGGGGDGGGGRIVNE